MIRNLVFREVKWYNDYLKYIYIRVFIYMISIGTDIDKERILKLSGNGRYDLV